MRAIPHVATTRRARAATRSRHGCVGDIFRRTASTMIESTVIAPMKIRRILMISASVSIFDLH
jgi:hypothetical protein